MRFGGWIVLVAAMIAALAVTAFALSRGGGPTPPKRPLAAALHSALSARPVAGVSAAFRVDTQLFPGGSSAFSTSPLNGATGHVWAAKGHVRIVVRSEFGTTELGYAHGRLVVYDRSHRVAYVLPVATHHSSHHAAAAEPISPSVADISHMLAQLRPGAIVSGAMPGDIAGRPAYTVRISPRHNGGLIGAAELAWDSAHGVPLRFAIYPRGSSTPAIAFTVTSIDYGRVPVRALTVRPARGTHIVHVHMPTRKDLHSARSAHSSVTGMSAVQKAVGFRLAAPASLVGMPRTMVRSVDLHGASALVTYGRGLGSVLVLEQRVSHDRNGPLSALPTVSVNGATGHELETTLGTLLQFSHGGVTYTIVGSHTGGTIAAAAQSLAG
ncbi:MAG: hypothetical protein ACTHNU_07430 [Gaiellales bacterium]